MHPRQLGSDSAATNHDITGKRELMELTKLINNLHNETKTQFEKFDPDKVKDFR